MKKILTALTLSLTALSNTVAVAAPYFDRSPQDMRPPNAGRGFNRDMVDDRDQQRRSIENRGVQRLKQHRWQPGYIMPQHYRGDGYKVAYRDHDLPKPSRNQQWYKINNDYILVDSDSNDIIKILGF